MQLNLKMKNTTAISRRKYTRNSKIMGYLFVTPQIIGLLLFVIIPFIFAIYLCFAKWDFIRPPEFVGFKNFHDVFINDSDVFLITLTNTLIFIAGTVPLTIIVSLSLALLTNRKIFALNFFKGAFFLPMVTSSVSVAVVWYWLYAPDIGLFNYILGLIGLSGPGWLAETGWSRVAVIIMQTWLRMGYYYIIFLAGIKGIPKVYYEAAEVDGASSLAVFRKITLPLLSPVTFFVIVMLMIDVFNMFSETYILTRGGPNYATYSLIMYIYFQAFQYFKMGKAAVASMVLFITAGTVTYFQFKLSRKTVNYDS